MTPPPLATTCLVVLLLCLGSAESKTFAEALKEFDKTLDKIGSGRCPHTKFMEYLKVIFFRNKQKCPHNKFIEWLQDSSTCRKGKKFSPTSHYCDDLG